MSDLISRKAAIDAIRDADVCVQWNGIISDEDAVDITVKATKRSLIYSVKKLPSAQPEQTNSWCINSWCNNCKDIVRCKDCKYNSNTCGNYVNCDIIPQMFGRTTDNFCSMAERRTDDSD